MNKNSNKRKSLTGGSPNKIQKVGTPVFKNKTPNKNQNTPNKKQWNGRQSTPYVKKVPQKSDDDEDESDEQEVDSNEESSNEVEQDSNEEAEGEESEDDDNDESENDDNADNDDTAEADTGKSAKVKGKDDRKFSLHVTGINYDTTAESLKKHFEPNVLSVFIVKNPHTQKSMGRGYVNMKNAVALKQALKKDGTTLNGRTLKVSKSEKKGPLDRKKKLLENLKRRIALLEKEISGQSVVQKKPMKPFIKKSPGKKGKKAT